MATTSEQFDYIVAGKFKDDLTAKSKSAFQRFKKNASSAMNAFKLAAVAAFAAAVLGIGKLVSAAIDLGDRFDKLNASFGISVETLSKLEFAAGRSGSSVEVMAKSFKKLQENIFDAGEGVLTANRAFDALGINVEELRQLRPEDQFKLIAGILSEIPDQATKTAVAFDIFGKGAEGVLSAAKDGAAGIDAMFKKSEELGIVMSTATATAMAEFNDLIFDLGKVIRSAIEQGLVPFLKIINDNREALENLAAMFRDIVIPVAKFFATAMLVAANAVNAVIAASLALSGALFKVFETLTGLSDAIGLTTDLSAEWRLESEAAFATAEEFANRVKPLTFFFNENAEASKKAAEKTAAQTIAMAKAKIETEKNAVAVEKASKANEKFVKTSEKVIAVTTKAIKGFRSPVSGDFDRFRDNAGDFLEDFEQHALRPRSIQQNFNDRVKKAVQDERKRQTERAEQEVFDEAVQRGLGVVGGSTSRGGGSGSSRSGQRTGTADSGFIDQIIQNGGNTIVVQGDINVGSDTFPNLGEQARRLTQEQGRQKKRGGISIGEQEVFLGLKVHQPKFSGPPEGFK